MYMMYVDESGDTGLLPQSLTNYYILTGIVIHESQWLGVQQNLYAFRQHLKDIYGFGIHDEIHTTAMFGRRRCKKYPAFRNPNDMLAVYRMFLKFTARIKDINIINVIVNKVDKTQGYDVFYNAWRALIQRFENTMESGNFPAGYHEGEGGIVFADETDAKKLKQIIRRLREKNVIKPSPQKGGGAFDKPLIRILEDPNFRNSADSFFIQMADVCVYSLKQSLRPSQFMRKKGADRDRYFNIIKPVLCKAATYAHPLGVVWL